MLIIIWIVLPYFLSKMGHGPPPPTPELQNRGYGPHAMNVIRPSIFSYFKQNIAFLKSKTKSAQSGGR